MGPNGDRGDHGEFDEERCSELQCELIRHRFSSSTIQSSGIEALAGHLGPRLVRPGVRFFSIDWGQIGVRHQTLALDEHRQDALIAHLVDVTFAGQSTLSCYEPWSNFLVSVPRERLFEWMKDVLIDYGVIVDQDARVLEWHAHGRIYCNSTFPLLVPPSVQEGTLSSTESEFPETLGSGPGLSS